MRTLSPEELQAELDACHRAGILTAQAARMLGISPRLAMEGLRRAAQRRDTLKIASAAGGCELRATPIDDLGSHPFSPGAEAGGGFLPPMYESVELPYSPQARAAIQYGAHEDQ